jgi:hypothetical protein
MQVANSLRVDSQSVLGHVEQVVHDAEFTSSAFGHVANEPIGPGGPYATARQTYEFGVRSVWNFLEQTTQGLADTAKTFAAAEGANSLKTTDLKFAWRTAVGYAAQPLEADGGRFTPTDGNEILIIAVAPMMEIWLFALGWIDACVDLCPLLLEAIVLFALIQPDDAEIQRVVQQWQFAVNGAASARAGVQRALNIDVPAAWPSAPDSFQDWRTKVVGYLDNLVRAMSQVPSYISAAADRVNQANQDLLYVLEGAFAALAAATALDVFFGIGETAKLAISVGVLVALQLSFLAILGDLRGLFSAMPQVPPLPIPHLGRVASAETSNWVPMPVVPAMPTGPVIPSINHING